MTIEEINEYQKELSENIILIENKLNLRFHGVDCNYPSIEKLFIFKFDDGEMRFTLKMLKHLLKQVNNNQQITNILPPSPPQDRRWVEGEVYGKPKDYSTILHKR